MNAILENLMLLQEEHAMKFGLLTDEAEPLDPNDMELAFAQLVEEVEAEKRAREA